jgi:hypothetical protein
MGYNGKKGGKDMDEKNKLHIRYIGIIALIITLGSVVLAGFNDQAFVGQFSFASTITSIILSVVAIWMSITGERGTNEIRCKVTEVVERLTNTTSNVEAVNTEFISTIEKQEELYKNIEQRLCAIIDSVESVKSEVAISREEVAGLFNNKGNSNQEDLTDDERKRIFKAFFDGGYNKTRLMVLDSLSIVTECDDSNIINTQKLENILVEKGYQVDDKIVMVIIGIYSVFRALGFYKSNYADKFFDDINETMKKYEKNINQQTGHN